MATRVLYFDCFSGIAGDMTLGALIDLGVDVDDLRSALQTLPVDGWTLDTSIARKSGLRGVDVQIRIGGESEGPAALDEDGLTGLTMDMGIATLNISLELTTPMTTVMLGTDIIETSSRLFGEGKLPESVVTRALAAFDEIARAEARVHGVTLEDVHFHEVGAVDSIIDICGVAWCLDALGIDVIESAPSRWVVASCAVRTAEFRCQHLRLWRSPKVSKSWIRDSRENWLPRRAPHSSRRGGLELVPCHL